MPKIIKNEAVVEDNWQTITDTEVTSVSQLPEGNIILPLIVYQNLKDELDGRNVGIWLNSDEPPETIKAECHDFPVIAINFPAFADGRGYSYAQKLSSQYGYKGDLRAIGDVLRDQLFYMKRCGFKSFHMREDQKLEEAIANLSDFSETYQASSDNPEPLFQRR